MKKGEVKISEVIWCESMSPIYYSTFFFLSSMDSSACKEEQAERKYLLCKGFCDSRYCWCCCCCCCCCCFFCCCWCCSCTPPTVISRNNAAYLILPCVWLLSRRVCIHEVFVLILMLVWWTLASTLCIVVTATMWLWLKYMTSLTSSFYHSRERRRKKRMQTACDVLTTYAWRYGDDAGVKFWKLVGKKLSWKSLLLLII